MSAMILMGSLINTYEAYLPQFFISSIRYGKFAIEGRKLKILEVPKSWFKHFYVFSALSSIGAIILAVSVYVFGKAPPVSFMLVLDATVGSLRYSTGSFSFCIVGKDLQFFFYCSIACLHIVSTCPTIITMYKKIL